MADDFVRKKHRRTGLPRHPSNGTIEDARGELICLSIRDWADRGLLHPGTFTLTWTEDGQPTGLIKVQIDTVNPVHPAMAGVLAQPVPATLRAVLDYHVRQAGAPPEAVQDEIWLDRKRRGFAAARPLFTCPGCSRRVAELYFPDGYFRCRRCCRLNYQSQRHSRETRGLQKAAHIKRRLGGTGESGERVPERPKGMHRRTYERLCQAVAKAEGPWHEGQRRQLQRFLARFGLLPEGDQADLARTARAAQRVLENPELLKRGNRPRRRRTARKAPPGP